MEFTRKILKYPTFWECLIGNKPASARALVSVTMGGEKTANCRKRERSPRTGLLHGVTVGKRERAEQAAINSSLHPAEAKEKSQHRKNATLARN